MVTKIGAEFLVNTQTAGFQSNPSVTLLASGGFVVNWQDSVSTRDVNFNIKAQVFDADGARIGTDFLVNTQVERDQYAPSVTGLALSGFATTWYDSFDRSVKLQVFDSSGGLNGSEVVVNPADGGSHENPSVTSLSNGGFIVVWEDWHGTPDIKARLFDSSGASVGDAFIVGTHTAGEQVRPTVTSLANGSFVVSWSDLSGTLGDNSATSIKMQIYDSYGVKIGTETRVNTVTHYGQFAPAVTGLAGGGFVVTWEDLSGTMGDSSQSIKAQIFSAVGTPVGTEFLVNTQTAGFQRDPVVAALENGSFVIGWADSETGYVTGQVFDAGGGKLGSEFLISSSGGGFPSISSLGGDRFVVTWTSDDIKAQIFSIADLLGENVLETDGAPVSGTVAYFDGFDTITSSDPGQPVSIVLTDAGLLDLSDELGTTGATVKASAGGNTITTGAGADTLTQIFSDLQPGATVTFRGGAGLDTLDLSAGTLTAFTSTIDPDGAVRFTAGGRTVVVSDMERFVINGSNVSDVFQGSQGADSLNGKGGDDIYNGSAGDDSYVFSNAGDTVTGERSSGGIDTIWSTITVDLRNESAVENLRLQGSAAIDGTGNNLANTITGNAASNVIAGGLGNDKLYGKGGADAFVFAERYSAHQDAILDFDADDTIILDGAVFQNLDKDGDGILDAGALQMASTATGTGATLVYRAFNGLLSYDPDGAGSGGTAAIATIGKSLTFLDEGDIRIKGQASTIAGQDTGTVTEDGVVTASGTLTVSDPDAGQRAFKVHGETNALQGTFGTLVIDAQGNWTYRLTNDDDDVQALGSGDTETDRITVTAVDGTEHQIVVTIGGAADGPATPLTATFEELGSESLYTMYIPDNYLGFLWSSAEGYYHDGYFVDLYVAGFDYSASKTDKVMFNGHGGRTSSLVRSDGSDFGVTGLDIADGNRAHLQESTSSLDANTVWFFGYRDGALVATKLATLSNDHFDRVAFNADFADIDRFEIVATGGSGSTVNPGAGWWSIDNIGFLV